MQILERLPAARLQWNSLGPANTDDWHIANETCYRWREWWYSDARNKTCNVDQDDSGI